MIVAGFGFSSSATVASLQSALAAACDGIMADAFAAPTDKAGTDLFQRFAADRGCPVLAIAEDRLQAVETQTSSARVMALRGTGSVAEAAALAACDTAPDARLLTRRHISNDRQATCAVAIGGQT